MVFLDNGSTDGTVEALKGYENVTVLRSMLPKNRPLGLCAVVTIVLILIR